MNNLHPLGSNGMRYLAKFVHFDVVWPNKEKIVHYMVTGSHSNEEWERLMDWWLREEDPSRPPKPILDLDEIYKDGKLFGCNIICNLICEDEIPQFKLDYYREEDGKHYILDYNFDWEHESFILSYIKFENGIPYKARIETNFHMLFEVKTDLKQVVFKHAAESVIREVEKLIDNDN